MQPFIKCKYMFSVSDTAGNRTRGARKRISPHPPGWTTLPSLLRYIWRIEKFTDLSWLGADYLLSVLSSFYGARAWRSQHDTVGVNSLPFVAVRLAWHLTNVEHAGNWLNGLEEIGSEPSAHT
ncbi:hypothetical protein BU16DRAFT_59706 [Lophium mytilinum]|uniref:Uncharacterized protein n=1 Tax=Lophium mytilinum TaxID=390894 RepID=A0A6A6QP47_9PEZI|nr:hypothetical protein BU16DRAFT_59706 [Lophium mytilinum]